MTTSNQIMSVEFPRLKHILEEEKKGIIMNEQVNAVTSVVELDGTKATIVLTPEQIKAIEAKKAEAGKTTEAPASNG